ncbi:MAG: uroporphyrinogen decarboxylase family protein [Verrucomicrobiae bacterium]|nr:uroporphyrinogen decarboxylase family protein [Verrucomicrobiae bacterium]
MPIAVYPGVALTRNKVCEVTHNSEVQLQAQTALHLRYHTPFVLSAMDLSAEAEAFGCTLHESEDEVPSVTGRLITTLAEAQALEVPQPGTRRTAVYLETVARLRRHYPQFLVLGGCIGPFSLAARLAGVSEAMELIVTEPELMHTLLQKSTDFLRSYLLAFHEKGADGVIMAEPAAGLLSPRMMQEFSCAYIRQLVEALPSPAFALIYHNCAAKVMHLPVLWETGVQTFHFGAPMDITAALAQAPQGVVLCGNLDPTGVFVQASPSEVAEKTRQLLSATKTFRNFVISSGCDVPARAPLANLDAFFKTVDEAG